MYLALEISPLHAPPVAAETTVDPNFKYWMEALREKSNPPPAPKIDMHGNTFYHAKIFMHGNHAWDMKCLAIAKQDSLFIFFSFMRKCEEKAKYFDGVPCASNNSVFRGRSENT